MGKPVYSFGRFRLDPLARELRRDGELVALPASAFDCLVYLVEHRERPVGRDELIAAVWGRAEVSDNLLAQHIVRLRRCVDDAEPSCIRTVPRVGYHWVAETAVVHAAKEAAPAAVHADAPAPAQAAAVPASAAEAVAMRAAGRHSRRRLYGWLALLAALCLALSGAWWWQARLARTAAAAPSALVVVLPAKVEASADWGWLRYGLMDIVASHVQAAGLRTVPSEVVMRLVRDGGDNAGAQRFDAAWQVEPTAVFADGAWRIHLDLRARDGHAEAIDAAGKDVLVAARQVSDALLLKLGAQPRPGHDKPTQLDDWLSKVAAARLDNHIDVAQQVVDEVPAAWRDDPKVAYVRAVLECDRGERQPCEKHLQELIARLTDPKDAVLRARAMDTLGLRYAAASDRRAAPLLDEAIAVFEKAKANEYLGNAYLNRAWLAQSHDQLDVAMAYLGKGRATYNLAGDIYGIARADFDMGLIAARGGHLDSAMAFLQKSYDQFARYGARTMLPSLLDGMASVARLQLKFREELAITDKFWPLSGDLADVHMRRELTLVRAIALADNGRLLEAGSLARQLMSELDPKEDAALAAEVPELLAQVALDQGDYAAAARFARQALAPDELDQMERSATWLMLVKALQRGGRHDEAVKEAAAFRAWTAATARATDWFAPRADLAEAETGDDARARQLLEAAMPRAQATNVPEIIVGVGEAYAGSLLKAGQAEQAMAISGTLSAWAQDDLRVVLLEARIYQALGHADARDKALERARQLAGERPVAD